VTVSSHGRHLNKTFAAVLALALLLVVLLSSVYIAVESGHACHGEECPICEHIEECRNILRQVSEIITGCAVCLSAAIIILLVRANLPEFLIYTTPVRSGVRLNR